MNCRTRAAAIYRRAGIDDARPVLMAELATSLFGPSVLLIDTSLRGMSRQWVLRTERDGFRIVLPSDDVPEATNIAIAEALAALHMPRLEGWRDLAGDLAMPARALDAHGTMDPHSVGAAFVVPVDVAMRRLAHTCQRPRSGIRAAAKL